MKAILAQPEHSDILGEVIARAFVNDPICTHVFPDRERRLRNMRWIHARQLCVLIGRNSVYTTPDLLGAAVWHRPEAGFDMGLLEQIRAGFLPIVFMLRPSEQLRGLRVYMDVVARTKRFVRTPHWVLDTLCVALEHHRKGVARALLQPALQQADTDGIPCFVITHNPVNVPFYERFGFHVVYQSLMPGSEVMVYSLIREPGCCQSSGTSSPAPAVE